MKNYKEKLLSFGAGISIAYLFLELLPRIHEADLSLREVSYIFILVGFAFFHLIEKYVYQHVRRDKLVEKLKNVHSFGFFIYHFIVGIVLFYITSENIIEGTLFLIPVLFHASVSSVSAKEIHPKIKENKFFRLFLSSSTILGVLVFYLFNIPPLFIFIMLGFVVGALLYIIIKDILPEKKEGDPKYFILGISLFLLLIIALRNIYI